MTDKPSQGQLVRLDGSKGGKARAARLSPAERQAIARRAAAARWGESALPAQYYGELRIGGLTVDCAVTDDGQRLINQQTLLTVLGRSPRAKGGTNGPQLLAANLRPFISPELDKLLSEPVSYLTPSGLKARGYPADTLPELCEVYLDARKEDVLLRSQRPAADAAEILIRGLARVGITALIDEATGYQEVRARDELRRILDAYVAAELRPWTKTFPDEFFRQIYRLQGWQYKPGTAKRTPYVGHLINKYIYEQLPKGVLEELQDRNPRNERGYRAHRHHQFLTADTGNQHLDRQISTVTTLMRVASSRVEFEDLFDRAFPPQQPKLPLIVDHDGNVVAV